MPLSWTEIRDRATAFQKRWKDDTSEQAELQSFWAEFLNIFGVDRKKVGIYEKQVHLKRARAVKNGRIDLFWPGKLLVEMKSAGQDVDKAFAQAADYFEALPRQLCLSPATRGQSSHWLARCVSSDSTRQQDRSV